MRRIGVVIVLLLVVACAPAEETADTTPVESTTTSVESTTTTRVASTAPSTTQPAEMAVTSPAFEDESAIPAEHTCDGADVSPQLDVSGLPSGTRTLAIVVDDPEAALGTWDHWVEYEIPAGPGTFVFPSDTPPLGVHGINSWRIGGYMGPCPPEGEEHTYSFTVYALDASLDLPEGIDSETLRSAMTGNTLGTAVLRGTYSR